MIWRDEKELRATLRGRWITKQVLLMIGVTVVKKRERQIAVWSYTDRSTTWHLRGASSKLQICTSVPGLGPNPYHVLYSGG